MTESAQPEIPQSGVEYLRSLGREAKAKARQTPDGGLELMPDGTDGIFDEGRNDPIPASSAQTRVIKPGQPAPKTSATPQKSSQEPQKQPEKPQASPEAPKPQEAPKMASPEVHAEPPKASEVPHESPEAMKERLEAYRKTFIERALPKMPEPGDASLPKDVLEKADALMAEGKSAEAYTLISKETMKLAVRATETRSETRTAQEDFITERAEVNEKVFERHPELLEFEEKRLRGENAILPDTPFTKELQKVYSELGDAFIAQNARAPQIAMEMAESRLRDKAKAPELAAAAKTAEQAAAEERTRGAQAMAGAAVGGSRVPAGAAAEPVVLDETQRRVAMKMRMSPEDYAKYGGANRVLEPNWASNQRPRRPGRA